MFRGVDFNPLSTFPDENSSTVIVYCITCQRRSSFGPGPDVKTQNSDTLSKLDKYSAGHLTIMKLRSDPFCLLCKEDSETSLQFLGYCAASHNGY